MSHLSGHCVTFDILFITIYYFFIYTIFSVAWLTYVIVLFGYADVFIMDVLYIRSLDILFVTKGVTMYGSLTFFEIRWNISCSGRSSGPSFGSFFYCPVTHISILCQAGMHEMPLSCPLIKFSLNNMNVFRKIGNVKWKENDRIFSFKKVFLGWVLVIIMVIESCQVFVCCVRIFGFECLLFVFFVRLFVCIVF